MMAARAQVSAIVPVFNGERYLEEALRSAVDQSLPPFEVIVVDDGSTDSSVDIAESFGGPVRCIRQANAGVAGARNRGLQAATGEFIAFLDQDDLWPQRKLENQVATLRANPDVGVVSGRIRVFGGPIPGRAWTGRGDRASEIADSLNLGCSLIRRSVFDQIGLLREDVGTADDMEWLTRVRDLGVRKLRQDIVTLLYRWHGENTSADIEGPGSDALDALKISIDRRRGKSESRPG
jgi:glycosyltransferase involved in cell wall biosynthesis